MLHWYTWEILPKNNVIMVFNWFLDLAKDILSLLIACMKGKIKVNIGLSILSDLVSIL